MANGKAGRRRIEIDEKSLIEDSKTMTLMDMALKYGVVPSTIFNHLKRLGLGTNTYRRVVRGGDAFVDAYNSGTPDPAYKPAYATPIARRLGTLPDGEQDFSPAGPQTVEEAVKVLSEMMNYSGKAPDPCSRKPKAGMRKILLLNDIHAPYHDKEALMQAIKEQEDADLVLVGGDLCDMFAVSRYEKYEYRFSLNQELREAKAILNLLSAKFPEVIVMPGNHDDRWKKHLVRKRGIDPVELEAMTMIAQWAGADAGFDIGDPLFCMTHDLTNVRMARPIKKDFASFSFFMQIGDLIVSHAEKFSRITNQAANGALKWYQSCALPMGLVQPFRVLAQCHTHQAGLCWADYGVWAMECGCLAQTPDYAANPKLMGAGRPSVRGYSVFYQDRNGRTDMRESRFIPIEG